MPPDPEALVIQCQSALLVGDNFTTPPWVGAELYKDGTLVVVPEKATDKQVGGSHYRKYGIQPVEFCVANNLGFLAGNVVKYVTRYKDKNGAEDIRKAIHYLELILEFEYSEIGS